MIPPTVPQFDKSRWVDARVLSVDVDIDADAAQVLLPPPLLLSDPPRATIFCADYPEGAFGIVYSEAAVFIHCRDDKGPAVHCPWIMVDDDTALILGREVLGYPKKMAEITWEETGDEIVGTVSRKGFELLRMEGRLGAEEPNPPAIFERRFVNALGSVAAGMQLAEFTPAETFHSARMAEITLKLESSAWDPGIGELAPTVTGAGVFAILDMGGGPEPQHFEPLEDVAWATAQFLPRMI